ncbi:MAG: hypothetical protein KDC54_00930 [Lewinella sp.]|nr:hypothetical protein [Lewinella sp.]
MLKNYLCCLFGLWLSTAALFGQSSLPYGLTPDGQKLPDPEVLSLSQPDYATWIQEDERNAGVRFAGALPVDLSPPQAGSWTELPDGRQLWRLQLTVPAARALAVFFDQWQMPRGAELFAYTRNENKVFGPYTTADATDSRRFWLGFAPGETIILEYLAPSETTDEPFHLWRLDAAYRPEVFNESVLMTGFGASSSCHDNINCPTGDAYQTEKAAVARINVVVEEGTGYCSGTLINNTAQDGTPYLLTAFHCMDGYTPLYDMWRFDFGYEAPGCPNPSGEPAYTSVLGSTLRAGRQANDFLLLELDNDQAAELDLHFLGWDRSGVPPASAGVIHHPVGDIKKIALSTTPSTVFIGPIDWNNGVTTPPQHHYRVTYSNGIIELGSSGSALLAPSHRIVGQLHGDAGINNCNDAVGYFGRFSYSWTGGGTPATRLSDWLDPLGLDSTAWDPLTLAGSALISREDGSPLGEVQGIYAVDGMPVDTVTSDVMGTLPRPTGLPSSGTLTLTLSRDEDDYDNGVTVTDITRIQREILGTVLLDSPVQRLAADVNLSGSVTTLDIIKIRKVILTIEPTFEGAPSWLFIPVGTTINDPQAPWSAVDGTNTFTFDLAEGFSVPDFIAVKTGDTNGTAQ